MLFQVPGFDGIKIPRLCNYVHNNPLTSNPPENPKDNGRGATIIYA